MATELDKPEYTSLLPYELILQPIFSKNEIINGINLSYVSDLFNKCDDISPGFSKDFIELFMHEDDFNLPISTVILNGWCKLKRTIKLSDAEAVKLNKDLENFYKTLSTFLADHKNENNFYLCIRSTAMTVKGVVDNSRILNKKYFELPENSKYSKDANNCRKHFVTLSKKFSSYAKTSAANSNFRHIEDIILCMVFVLDKIITLYNLISSSRKK